MKVNKLLSVLNTYESISALELRMIFFKTLLNRPSLTLATPRFKSLRETEDWLVNKGYDPQFYAVYGENDDDYYLEGSRIYYSYTDRRYYDEYDNLLLNLKDISPKEEQQLLECMEHIWMIAITKKQKIVLI